MFNFHRLLGAMTIALLLPGFAAAQDRDTQEVQKYVLTSAGLAKYTKATENLSALQGPAPGACEDSDATTINDMVAALDGAPEAKAAITSAGMTTREYIVFSWSILQTGLGAWAVSQPGGKLPPGVSKANVDFYKAHEADLQKLEALKQSDECEQNSDEDGE